MELLRMLPYKNLIETALTEDIGTGDITTDAIVPHQLEGRFVIISKEKKDIVAAGIDVAKTVFLRVSPKIIFTSEVCDGDTVHEKGLVLAGRGPLAALLTAERTALNFLQRLTGIATNAYAWAAIVAPFGVRLVDTRKTTPGLRVLEKYAVRTGGAYNHRMGLFDGVLIKDNHILAAGGILPAVQKVRGRVSHLVKIEVETANIEEVKEALSAGADVIMLDNMTLPEIRKAVQLINKKALIEVSGNVTESTLKDLAETGVDMISSGALTHSAKSADLSMRIEPCHVSST